MFDENIHDVVKGIVLSFLRIALFLTILPNYGCENKDPSVYRITVSPVDATITIGKSVQLTATPEDKTGKSLNDISVVWSSENASLATVTPEGVVSGISEGGPVIIKASCEGKEAISQVTVTPVPVSSISLEIDDKTIEVGESFQLNTILKDDNGNLLTGRVVEWNSADPGVVSVSQTGNVTGISEGGPLELRVVCEGKSSSVNITVIKAAVATVEISPVLPLLQVESSVKYLAIARDKRGGILKDRTASWSSSDHEIAPISSSGLVGGLKCGGPVTITATVEGKSVSFHLTVARLTGISVMFGSLEGYLTASIAYNQGLLEKNPSVATQINEKIAMLQDPALASKIREGNFYAADSVLLMNGKQVTISLVFPYENMREEVDRSRSSLKEALPLLESFVGTPFYYNHLYEWYGFRIGNTNVGDVINMEDRDTYEARTKPDRLLYEDILLHELSHCYTGNETLTHFLAVYLYNMIHTNTTDIKSWIYFEGTYNPLTNTNTGLNAILDIYTLIGHDAMMRAFKSIVALYPQYGVPLSSEVKQAIIDQASADLKNTVAAKTEKI